jgi:hypothetical protein
MKRLVLLFAILLFVAPLSAQYASSAVASDPELMGDGRFKIALTFKGDAGEADVRHEFYAASLADLQAQARTFAATLNAVINDVKTLTVGAQVVVTPPVPVVLPPPTPVPPTPEQMAAQALSAATFQYEQIAKLVSLGALDPSIGDAALANVKAAAALQAPTLATTVEATTKSITDLGGAVEAKPTQPGAQQ